MQPEELLQAEEESWQGLADAAQAVPEDRRAVEGVVPGWSAHDAVWHCIHWADYVAAWLEMRAAGQEGEPEEVPEADILAQGRAMSWQEMFDRAQVVRERVRAAIAASPNLDDETVSTIRGETYGHYDEHAAEIRAFVG